jgi:hypothetical protein
VIQVAELANERALADAGPPDNCDFHPRGRADYGTVRVTRPGPVILCAMCRNIRTLFNFDPPATDEEVRAASLQFVRKVSGFTKPSRANQAAFDDAVRDVTAVARGLIDRLVTGGARPRS